MISAFNSPDNLRLFQFGKLRHNLTDGAAGGGNEDSLSLFGFCSFLKGGICGQIRYTQSACEQDRIKSPFKFAAPWEP